MGPIGCPETSVRNYHYSLRAVLLYSATEAWNQAFLKDFRPSSPLIPHPAQLILRLPLFPPRNCNWCLVSLCLSHLPYTPRRWFTPGEWGGGWLNHGSSFSKKPNKTQGTWNLNTATGKYTTKRPDERTRILINKRWPRRDNYRSQL